MTHLMRSDTCAILNPDLISKLDGRLRRNEKKKILCLFFNEKALKEPAGRNRMGLSDLTDIHQ